jgi:sterol 3beta-glucosyltransferase
MSSSSTPSKAAAGKTFSLAVVCTGLRYDVAQHLALAYALQRVGGFRVKLVAPAAYADQARAMGLAFTPLRGDPSALVRTSAFRDAVASHNLLAIAALFKKETDATLEANMGVIHDAVAKSATPCDALVCSIAVLTECLAIGQKYQKPVLLAPLLPYSPSGELPLAQMVPEPSKYAFLNRLSYDVSGALLWSYLAASYNRFRTKTLGIGPQPSYVLEGVPQVTAFSPAIIAPPSDWGPWIHLTAHWRLPENIPLVAARTPTLCALLEATAPADLLRKPVVVDFEGMPLPDPVGFVRACHALGTKHGVSVIVCAGDADAAAAFRSPRLADLPDIVVELPGVPAASVAQQASAAAGRGAGGSSSSSVSALPRVLIVASIPHAWAFSRASCAVHQGGAAITQAAMAAGIPSVAFPAFGEQFFWAARISALGVGPAVHFPLREAAARLDECVSVARQVVIVTAAGQLGLASEGTGDGAVTAVMTIRDLLNRPQHRHCGVTCTWEPDESRQSCSLCSQSFTLLNRRRHCRSCGRLACTKCFTQRCHLPGYPENAPQITCERCLDHRRAYFAMAVGEACVPDLPPDILAGLGGGGAGGAGADSVATAAADLVRSMTSPGGAGGGGGGGGGAAGGRGGVAGTPARSTGAAAQAGADFASVDIIR